MNAPASLAPTLPAALLQSVAGEDVLVPPPPGVMARLKAILDGTGISLRDLGGLIAQDPALAAETLRRANSADSTGRVAVTALPAAIARLGLKEILRIIFTFGAGRFVATAGPLQEIRQTLWRDALLVAYTAEALASRQRLEASTAFAVGILHDFGRIVALAHVERLLAKLDVAAMDRAAWFAVVDAQRPRVAQLVVERWALPPPISNVVLHLARAAEDPEPSPYLQLVVAAIRAVVFWLNVPCPSIAALARETGLDPDACQALEAMLPEIIAGAASSACTAPIRTITASKITAVPSNLGGERWPVGCPATLLRAGRPDVAMRAEYVTPHGLILSSPEPVSMGLLMRLRVQWAPQPFELFASVARVQQDGDHFALEVVPMGLGGEAKEAWDRLQREGRPQRVVFRSSLPSRRSLPSR